MPLGAARAARGGGVPVPRQVDGLAHWYDATELTSFLDGDSVDTWPDEEGTDDLTQGTGSDQPTYQTNVIGGNPIVRFNGSNHFMDVNFTDLSQPNHIFITGAYNDATSLSSPRNILDSGTIDTNNRHVVLISQTNDDWSLASGVEINSGTTVTTGNHIVSAKFDSPNSVLRLNGSEILSGDSGSDAMSGLTLATFDGNGEFVDFDFGEVLIYDAGLSSNNLNAVESYLSDKWSISI